jgi:hypothetical protein
MLFSLLHIFQDLFDLTVCDVYSTGHPEQREDGNEDPPRSKPVINVPADEEAQHNAAGNGKTELHYNMDLTHPIEFFHGLEKHLWQVGPNDLLHHCRRLFNVHIVAQIELARATTQTPSLPAIQDIAILKLGIGSLNRN